MVFNGTLWISKTRSWYDVCYSLYSHYMLDNTCKCFLIFCKQLKELYSLLNENYVEDEDNMFRFDYSPQFLKWALKPPNWVQDWHCGVRVTKSKKLVGFISAIPATIRVFEK